MTWTNPQRRRIDDALFRRAIEDARNSFSISDVIGRRTKLKRSGPAEHVGLCVFHEERTPSLYCNDAEGVFHCFGCGKSGDAIRFVMDTEGLRFFDALEALGAKDLPIVLEQERAKIVAENAAARAAAIGAAVEVWESGRPAAGTAAEVYARSRGIVMPLPDTIRFAMTPRWRNKETGEVGPDMPALVGAVTRGDEMVAVQRIFLRNGGRAKANGKRPKLSLGRVLGGALKLDEGRPASDEVVITEGPEDALSLAQELPDRRVWATLGTAMMPSVVFGPDVRRITIAGQNDSAGRVAVDAAAARLVDLGFVVRAIYPAEGFKDWNDQLRGIHA